MFLKWASLGSEVHVTEAEKREAYKVCVNCIKSFASDIACIAVDNAARLVANAVALKLKQELDMNVLVLRSVNGTLGVHFCIASINIQPKSIIHPQGPSSLPGSTLQKHGFDKRRQGNPRGHEGNM